MTTPDETIPGGWVGNHNPDVCPTVKMIRVARWEATTISMKLAHSGEVASGGGVMDDMRRWVAGSVRKRREGEGVKEIDDVVLACEYGKLNQMERRSAIRRKYSRFCC